MSELRECPFCGGKNISHQIIDVKDREGTPTNCICDDCGGASGFVYAPSEKPSSTWNTRHTDALIQRLRDALDGVIKRGTYRRPDVYAIEEADEYLKGKK